MSSLIVCQSPSSNENNKFNWWHVSQPSWINLWRQFLNGNRYLNRAMLLQPQKVIVLNNFLEISIAINWFSFWFIGTVCQKIIWSNNWWIVAPHIFHLNDAQNGSLQLSKTFQLTNYLIPFACTSTTFTPSRVFLFNWSSMGMVLYTWSQFGYGSPILVPKSEFDLRTSSTVFICIYKPINFCTKLNWKLVKSLQDR